MEVPDLKTIDTRVKSLMQTFQMSHDQAKQVLQDFNWDVNRARESIIRRSGYLPSNISTAYNPVMNVGQTQTGQPKESMDYTSKSNVEGHHRSASSSSQNNVSDDVDSDMPGPRLQRGMSKATINIPIVLIARDILQKDAAAAMEQGDEDDAKSFIQTTEFTFMLPDLTCYPEDFKAFLYKDLIDTVSLVSLEQGGHLNWWADIGICQRLFPMATSGDGNCLLHAASLGMWGLHDRQLILRKLLCDALANSSSAEAFKRRWRYQQSSDHRQCDLVLSEAEWNDDWKFLLKLSSPQPRSLESKLDTDSMFRYERSSAGQSNESEPVYESLEELHVFVLAHVLRRPIIVVSKTVLQGIHGDAVAPIPFGGIYLPLEWDPRQCHSSPLLLTYDLGHFCSLVPMEEPSGNVTGPHLAGAVPLVSPDLEMLLPLQFAVDPGPKYDFSKNMDVSLSQEDKLNLINKYFVVEQIPIPQVQRDYDASSEGLLNVAAIHKIELTKSDSEDSVGSGKDRNVVDDFDKKTIPKPMKFITKSFDSLGSKLKNITKINKTGRLERKASIGFATQSTRTSSFAAEMLEDRNSVLCAKLHLRKTGYQDQLVRNYIASMKEKFNSQHVQRQEQNAEIRRLSIERQGVRHGALPVEYSGRPIENQRMSAILDERGQRDVNRNQKESRVLQSYGDPNEKSFQRQNTIVVAGKSKFYTDAAEDQCPDVDSTRDFKIPEDLNKKDLDQKTRRYTKLDTMQLQAMQNIPESNVLKISASNSNGSGTLPHQTAKLTASGNDGTRKYRMAGSRHSADPSVFRKILDDNPEQGAKNYPNPVRANPAAASNTTNISGSEFGGLTEAIDRENAFKFKELGQRMCRTEGCSFYGTSDTNFLCSQCFKQEKKTRPCLNSNCKNEGDPANDNLCKLCFQKKRYSYQVQYPTTKTKF